MAGRITGIMAGNRTGLGTGTPELCGAGRGWDGFLIEAHVVGPTRDEVDWSWHSTHIGVCTAGEGDIQVSADRCHYRYRARPGNLTIFPRGFGPASIRQYDGRCRFVVVELDVGRLVELFPEVRRAPSLTPPPIINGRDAQVSALIDGMQAEVAAGCPSGALYAHSLSLSLAAYVAGRYAARPLDAVASTAGLSWAQRSRIIDHIDTHLDCDLGLAELARTVDRSPRHFLRLFRRTFGTTPHRYVAGLRLDRAKALLAAGRLPIAEVAMSLGFTTQSHFTDVFHRATGLTPARYRRGR